MIKFRRERSAGHASRMGKMRKAFKIFVEELEDTGVDGRITLN
jgi:hypothetical protein